MWKDVLQKIDYDYNLGTEFNESLLEARLPNGSVIRLMGVDTDEKQQRKLLGGKYKLVVVDEASFFSTDLEELVYKTIIPATADLQGEVWLVSTASDNVQGLFYDVTTGKKKGWEVHTWSYKDNPHTAKEVQAVIDKLIEDNPLVVETPHFRQHYLNEWVVDLDALVYKYNPTRNLFDTLPQLKYKQTYHYILGIDLGWEDATSFVVMCYNESDPTIYIVDVYKQKHLDFTDTANYVKRLYKLYDFDVCVVDGANKQGVEEMNTRHSLNLVPMIGKDKQAKNDYITLFNAELIQGRIKVQPTKCKLLTDEWAALIWQPHVTKHQEDPTKDNHAADAALYAWRYTVTYLWKPEDVKPKVGSTEWHEDQAKKLEEEIIERKQREKEEDPFADYNKDDALWNETFTDDFFKAN